MARIITKQYTIAGYVGNVLGITFIGFLLSSVIGALFVKGVFSSKSTLVYNFGSTSFGNSFMLFGIVIFVGTIVEYILRRRGLAAHHVALMQYANVNALRYELISTESNDFNDMSLYKLSHNSQGVENFVEGNDWVYAEYSYKVMRQLKGGQYQAATVYYGAMTTQLPRDLPNVFFDSKQARGRQFRFLFAKSQRH